MASKSISLPSVLCCRSPNSLHRSPCLLRQAKKTEQPILLLSSKKQALAKLGIGVSPCLRINRLKVLSELSACDSIASMPDVPAVDDNLQNVSPEVPAENDNLQNVSRENIQTGDEKRLLRVLILAVLAAAAFTVFSVLQPQAGGSLGYTGAGFQYQIRLFGRKIQIADNCPGYVYFWLLMAAGFGLFISEEALNVWIGATVARTFVFNGVWQNFVQSVSANAANVFSTFFWVYWGVCISDMIPFFAGRFAARTNAGDALCKQAGVDKKKLASITRIVQRYGNLIGFVERFSIGVRNPTSFLAGAMGVSPEKFFTGVCFGALITLPLQFGVGFLLRDRPVTALAMVTAVVGVWSALPYIAAGMTSIVFIFLKKDRH